MVAAVVVAAAAEIAEIAEIVVVVAAAAVVVVVGRWLVVCLQKHFLLQMLRVLTRAGKTARYHPGEKSSRKTDAHSHTNRDLQWK